ncbi:MAG TPA: branched-chain amino acid ABC transporter permease [Rhizobiaceae bacterium]|nr:branched-chain amino acid ABC transporter permease [Rhizobiaceae bacterium]
MNAAADIIFSGVFQGSLYAVMAVGLSLVWTTTGVFNFAHGALIMLGAYVCWQLVDVGGFAWPLYLALPATMLIVAALGWALQRALVAPFIGHPNIVMIVVITTLAMGSLVENAGLAIWGPRPKQLPALASGTVDINGFNASANQIAIILATPVVLMAVWLLLNRTRLGLSLRAVAQNNDSSLLVGLRPSLLYGFAFMLAAALAALAGIFLGSFKFMSPAMGSEPLTKALVVVIFGGIGSVTGPIFAAYLIGLIEATSNYFLGLYWTPTLLFAILIATLVIRPEGLISIRQRGLS